MRPQHSLPFRTVIITGASAGVGRAIALRFAQAGDRVGLIARDAAALAEVRDEALRLGSAAAAFETADVSDGAAVFAATASLQSHLGEADIWVNDAMETVFSPVWSMTPEEFRRVTEVTYLGFVHGTMAALKSMRSRERGLIIQVGSALAYRGVPLQSAYCGAKHAIRGFTDSVRAELLHEKSQVSITMIDLPAVNTPQFDWARAHIDHWPRPMGRPIQPEAVADAVFRAAQGSWREYWLGSPTLETILANMVWPGFLDRYLAMKAVAGQKGDQLLPVDHPDNLDRPITRLHRTRGSFSDEATSGAVLMPAPVMRAGVIVSGALICAAAGALLSLLGAARFTQRRPSTAQSR